MQNGLLEPGRAKPAPGGPRGPEVVTVLYGAGHPPPVLPRREDVRQHSPDRAPREKSTGGPPFPTGSATLPFQRRGNLALGGRLPDLAQGQFFFFCICCSSGLIRCHVAFL